MPTSSQAERTGLPSGLRERFVSLEGRLWRIETVLALCGAAAAPLATLTLLWFSDRFWDTPVWLRCALVMLGVAGLVAYALQWTRRWLIAPRDLKALSVLVQRQHRALGDRLLGAVELATEKKPPAGMSPSLCRAAIAQVTEDACRYDFAAAADPAPARRHGLALGAVALPLAALWLAVPQAGWNALQRWALPLADIERFTFVELAAAQPAVIVPHGEPFDVELSVGYRAFWRPSKAVARFGRQPELRGEVAGGMVRIAVPGQTQPGDLVVRVGDAEAVIGIEPMHRPALREMRAAITLPSYLQYPAREEPVRGGTLALLEGSRASFSGEVSRPIESASMRIDNQPQTALPVRESRFDTPERDWHQATGVSFSWRDTFGLTNKAPWMLTLAARPDEPPKVSLPGLPSDHAMLETDILPIKMSAQDDFGVKEVGIHWRIASALDPSGRPIERAFPFRSSSAQKKQVAETYLFSPSLLLIPPDTLIEVRGLATDFYPGRDPVLTEPHRIYVIGLVRHAEMVRQQLENLFAQLEEITRREETIAEKTREMTDLPEQKLAGEETAKRAGEQAGEQQRNARDLERLAREGANAVREAMRNPTFNEGTIREWARSLKAMQDVAQQEMQQAGRQLQSAQRQSQGARRSRELSQALQSERQALEKLQQLQQQVNKGLDSLQAQTLAQRLRKLGGQETQLEGRLQELVAETIGLLPSQLSEHHRRANHNIAGDQEGVRAEARAVHEEMSRFFDRTRRENYGGVAKEMKEANAEAELDRLRTMIASNITMQAMGELAGWAKRFKDWADKLEPKQEQAGGGQGGGTPQDDLMRQLMALLRMREKEGNLRQQTQLLDRQKQDAPNFAESAKRLAGAQRAIREDLQRVQRENGLPQLEEPLGEARQAMEQAEGILQRPETGEPADRAEVKVIEVLTDVVNLINEQAQRQSRGSQSAQAAAQEMEFLMQMAQQQPGQGMSMMAAATPGANRAGGGNGERGVLAGGDARGAGVEARSVNKASGSTRPVPTEFREALENYHRALEAKK